MGAHDFLNALDSVERDIYALRPSVLADDELPELSGAVRRVVALTLTWWDGELKAHADHLLREIGPETAGFLAERTPEELKDAVHALFEARVLKPAGPIEAWARIARLFGSMLDGDRRAVVMALETVAPDLLGRLLRRLRGAVRSEGSGREAMDAQIAGAWAAIIGAVEDGNPIVPDVAAAFAARVEAEAADELLPPGYTRGRNRLNRPIEEEDGGDSVERPDQAVEAAESLQAIASIVQNELTDHESAVLTRHAGGMSAEAIASDLDMSRGAVDVALHRARKKIRAHL